MDDAVKIAITLIKIINKFTFTKDVLSYNKNKILTIMATKMG